MQQLTSLAHVDTSSSSGTGHGSSSQLNIGSYGNLKPFALRAASLKEGHQVSEGLKGNKLQVRYKGHPVSSRAVVRRRGGEDGQQSSS